jgi:type I pantothenate kinase
LSTQSYTKYPAAALGDEPTLAWISEHIRQRYQGHEHTFVVAIAGSVAVGKSTLSTLLKEMFERWPEQPRVEVVSTDGFLYPNKVLEQRQLMPRKGFPESYRTDDLKAFLHEVRQGTRGLQVPVYSQALKDIDEHFHLIDQPDILILEGLNILQLDHAHDFSIYLDAPISDIRHWYMERFMSLTTLSGDAAQARADYLWEEVNLKNLTENILVTRDRAQMVLHKAPDHRIDEVWLREDDTPVQSSSS